MGAAFDAAPTDIFIMEPCEAGGREDVFFLNYIERRSNKACLLCASETEAAVGCDSRINTRRRVRKGTAYSHAARQMRLSEIRYVRFREDFPPVSFN